MEIEQRLMEYIYRVDEIVDSFDYEGGRELMALSIKYERESLRIWEELEAERIFNKKRVHPR